MARGNHAGGAERAGLTSLSLSSILLICTVSFLICTLCRQGPASCYRAEVLVRDVDASLFWLCQSSFACIGVPFASIESLLSRVRVAYRIERECVG